MLVCDFSIHLLLSFSSVLCFVLATLVVNNFIFLLLATLFLLLVVKIPRVNELLCCCVEVWLGSGDLLVRFH